MLGARVSLSHLSSFRGLAQPARFAMWQVGSSRAQHHVFDWTVAEAAVWADSRDVAMSLANERLTLKPRSHVNRRFARNAAAITSAPAE